MKLLAISSKHRLVQLIGAKLDTLLMKAMVYVVIVINQFGLALSQAPNSADINRDLR